MTGIPETHGLNCPWCFSGNITVQPDGAYLILHGLSVVTAGACPCVASRSPRIAWEVAQDLYAALEAADVFLADYGERVIHGRESGQ